VLPAEPKCQTIYIYAFHFTGTRYVIPEESVLTNKIKWQDFSE